MTEKQAEPRWGGVSIGGDVNADAGRDVVISSGDVSTSGFTFQADWRDSAMSALGDAEVSPVIRSHVGRGLDAIEEELDKEEPDKSVIQTLVGTIEQAVPLVATALRAALPFLK